jgi:hypothetical protein
VELLMNPIDQVVAGAARRLWWTRWCHAAVWGVTGALGVGLVILLLARLGIIAEPAGVWWAWAGGIGAGVVVVGAGVWAWAVRPSRAAVARHVDDAANLRESLSTALYLREAPATQDDAWSSNVLETATRAARGVRLSAAVPVRAPAMWYAPGVAALVLLIAWVTIPKMDVLGRAAAREAVAKKTEEVKAVAAQVEAATKKAESKLDEAMARLGEEPSNEKKDEALPKPTTPEEIRQAAMRRLTSMKDKVAQLKLSEKAQTGQVLSEKMKQLRSSSGPLREFTSELARGNLTAAQAALEQLAKSMSDGTLGNTEAAAAAQQLQQLAEQLKQLGEERKKLEEQLAKAGVDPKKAATPEALKQALKQAQENGQITPQQAQALQNAAQAQENAQQAMQAMAQAAQNLAQCMNPQAGQQGQQGQQGQEGQQQANASQAMSDMQQAMSQMEMAQADMASAEAAMNEAQQAMQQMAEGAGQCDSPGMGECQGGLGGEAGNAQGGSGSSPGNQAGEFAAGELDGQGGGSGGPGVSQGGEGVGEKTAEERWEKRKSRSPLGQGPMIGTMLVQGEQIKGESRAALIEMTESATQQATEAMENNVVPRELHDPIKRYFGRLAAKVKGTDAGAAAPAPAPAEKQDEKK